jgi:hypothetical protein
MLCMFAGFCALICLGVAAYAAPWTTAMQEARALRQFNRLWLARVTMQVVAAVWLVSEVSERSYGMLVTLDIGIAHAATGRMHVH